MIANACAVRVRVELAGDRMFARANGMRDTVGPVAEYGT